MFRKTILIVVAGLSIVACSAAEPRESNVLRIYSTVTQDTVDAVIAGFASVHPDAEVELFRAPTGEVTARIAAEIRDGGLQADILWLTDPLSIQQYEKDGMLGEWSPEGADAIPAEMRTASSFGTRVLNMVIVAGADLESPPRDWAELTTVSGGVAIPNPAFAGSAFAALGYFALSPDYGMDYYEALSDNGATQVQAPDDVITGVAEGIYAAGITLDRSARDAVADGSPIRLVWPTSGAISLYSPIAVVDDSSSRYGEEFVEYVLSVEGQTAIAATGWEPANPAVEWPEEGPQLAIDWTAAFDRQDELLSDYEGIFGE